MDTFNIIIKFINIFNQALCTLSVADPVGR